MKSSDDVGLALMWGWLAVKALVSGVIVAAVSEIARRYPTTGALVASLPLISVLGMLWLWHDKPDRTNMAVHSASTFWYVLPSLPMFLVIPMLLRAGVQFHLSLLLGCLLTIALYLAMIALAPRFGLKL